MAKTTPGRSKRYKTTLVRDGTMCAIPVPFDPTPVFGRVRAPVKVTLNGYTYRSTIAAMGGIVGIPLRKSNREAAGRFREGAESVAAGLGSLARSQLQSSARVRGGDRGSQEGRDTHAQNRR